MNQQRSKAWFEERRGLLTASSVGAALGLGPYRQPEDVIRAMVRDYHGAETEFTGNVATQYGVTHESGACSEYEMETGNTVIECGFYKHENGWLGASPDGLIDDDGLLEIKCPYRLRKGDGKHKSITEQPHYYAQIQIQLYCTGRGFCDFYQWSPGETMLERVDYNQEWIDENLPKLEAFYQQYLSELDSPEHLEAKRKIIENATAQKLIDEYNDVCDQLDFAAQRKKEIIGELVQMSGERDAEVCGRKLTKVEKAGAVSYAKVVKEHCPNVDLESYRGKASEYWKLT